MYSHIACLLEKADWAGPSWLLSVKPPSAHIYCVGWRDSQVAKQSYINPVSRRGPTYRQGGVERGKKGIPPSQMESSTVTFCLSCAKYGVSGDSEVSKTQPKHPKNSWSSWQNRNINRQKQHNLGMMMEAWCVSGWGGSTAVGV